MRNIPITKTVSKESHNQPLQQASVSGSRNLVVIGKETFKDAEEFKDYADEKMHEFLDNIQDFPEYTYPANNHTCFEYEEGITFYYTHKGSALVERWIKRMEAIFDKYFPYDYGFDPKCCYWRVW